MRYEEQRSMKDSLMSGLIVPTGSLDHDLAWLGSILTPFTIKTLDQNENIRQQVIHTKYGINKRDL